MHEVTRILSEIERGQPQAAEALLPLVYEELRRLAAERMAQEKVGHTLQATALVHEAYVRLVDADKVQQWNSRAHFFAAASEAMRRILVENARRKGRHKRGGEFQRVYVEAQDLAVDGPEVDILAIDEALTQLAAVHPENAAIVKLRYFTGLTLADAALALDISIATANRRWKYARAWLARRLAQTSDRTPQ